MKIKEMTCFSRELIFLTLGGNGDGVHLLSGIPYLWSVPCEHSEWGPLRHSLLAAVTGVGTHYYLHPL